MLKSAFATPWAGHIGHPGRATRKTAARVQPALLLLVGLALCRAALVSAEDSLQQRFLEGLRQRGLSALAVRDCRKQLSRDRLAPATRGRLTIELARSLAEQAVNSPPEARGPLWEEAAAAVERYAAAHPEGPLLPLVRLQGALVRLARGELERQEAQLLAGGEARLRSAREQLRAAIGGLRELDALVEARIRSGAEPADETQKEAALRPEELVAIQKAVRHELARALRNQGQSYPADSPDRVNSLTQAVQLLKPLAELDAGHPLAWPSRLDLIESYRLLRDDEKAARLIEATLEADAPEATVRRARAEQMLLALDAGRLSEAIDLFGAETVPADTQSPRLDFAGLRVCLAAWRAAAEADDRAKATAWQQRANDQVRRIEQFHGPYWARRAEMLLSGYVRRSPEAGDVEMLARAAESSYRGGRLDDAMEAYDRAVELARSQGAADRAFELAYVAATIEHRRDRHEAALRRYRDAALKRPEHLQAPEAHRLAAHHAGLLARKGRESADERTAAVAQYAALLEEHLQTWPEADTADGVAWLLGRLRQYQGDGQAAAAAYRSVSPESPHYAEAIAALGKCTKQWLDGLRAAGKPTQEAAQDAADWFASLVRGPEGNWPQSFRPVDRKAVLAAAEILLDYTSDGAARAERMLAVALRSPSDTTPEWTARARSLRLMALAAQGRLDEASAVLQRMGDGRAEPLLEVLDGLQTTMADAEPEMRREMAALQLRTIDALQQQQSQLTQPQRRSLQRLRAAALVDSGRIGEALREYEFLAKTYPRDAEIQEAFARLLASRNDAASSKQALERYRAIERRSPRGSPRWFRAKYAVAELQLRLGNREKAAKIITLLELLYPELGGPEMKEKFRELRRRTKAAG
jgi:tetratricopeptide (TPR) repeat protein